MGTGLSLLLCEQQWATRGQKEFRSVLLCYPLPSTHLGFSALPDQTIRRQASVIFGTRYHEIVSLEGDIPGEGEKVLTENMAYLRRLGILTD
jgi:hypothetical protein